MATDSFNRFDYVSRSLYTENKYNFFLNLLFLNRQKVLRSQTNFALFRSFWIRKNKFVPFSNSFFSPENAFKSFLSGPTLLPSLFRKSKLKHFLSTSFLYKRNFETCPSFYNWCHSLKYGHDEEHDVHVMQVQIELNLTFAWLITRKA
jgi:hypothetical protein